MGIIKLLVVTLCLSLNQYLVQGGRSSISKEEDLEFERQLKSLNKPPIKTFHTEHGDIIDCIDIYKQPALDHPLLKNHKIQMRPTFHPKRLIDESSSVDKPSMSVERRSISCPEGTVPIRRTRKEDLIRAKAFSNSYAANIHPQSTPYPGHHFASLRSIDTEIAYTGIGANINTHNPKVAADQASLSQMWIENGPQEEFNGLQAGWMVAPQLYGDTKTRIFIFWTADGIRKTGCFNFLCNGFIEIDGKNTIGDFLEPVSEYDGNQYEIKMTISRDTESGNWWLTYGENDSYVGYWPKELLPHLSSGASGVAWGGQTIGPPNGKSPEMGNGHFPDNDFNEGSWFRQLRVVNTSDYWVNPQEYHLKSIVDSPNCYGLKYYGYLKGRMGHTFLFGGPGGDCP